MKFVCRKCEAFMLFEEVEGVNDSSLGVTFGCPECGAKVAMVTNAGETQMVKTLGVQLGGRVDAHSPMELTRGSLAVGAAPAKGAPVPTTVATSVAASNAAAGDLKKSMGKCPFANVVADMSAKTQADAASPPGGPAVEVSWSAEARERLERVPDFVRSFAKTMIEDLARQSGTYRVDGALMDSAKEKFM